MKLHYNIPDDRKEIRNLTHWFLASRKGEIVSGLSARVLFNKMFGIDIDHHEWAYTLDWMTRATEEAQYHNRNGGDTQYVIS